MQLSLLDVSGKETANKAEIQWIEIEKLYPHPDNPRLIYKEEIITAIATSIEKDGFQPCYALLVRPFEDGYQILSGHTRLKASQQVGVKKLPCWVKEMTDEEAFFELVKANAQGELYPLEIGIHALKYVEPKQGVEGKGITEYAEGIGKDKSTISRMRNSAKVLVALTQQVEKESLLNKANHLNEISKTPESYWQQLTELLIKNGWTVKETEEICKAVRDIEIPEKYHFWLNPDEYIKKTINESLTGNLRTPRDVKNWIETAEECYEKLDEERKVTLIVNDKETVEYWNLKQQFLDKLPSLCQGDKKPSKIKIEGLVKTILDNLEKLDKQHKKWLTSKASAEEQKKEKERQERERLALIEQYAPVGFNIDFREYNPECEIYDAIITDVPYVVSNGGTTVRSGKEVLVDKNFEDRLVPSDYLMQCHDFLKEGGYFITTCTMHIYNDLLNEAKKLDFEHLQTIIVHWLNAPPLFTADRFKPNYDFLPIFYKKGGKRFINKEVDLQEGSVWQFPICGGNARIKNQDGKNLHDTQKPLELYKKIIETFVPVDGLILEPFAGTGTTVVASKQLKRKCHWIELDEVFYQEAQDRIEQQKYWFEV